MNRSTAYRTKPPAEAESATPDTADTIFDFHLPPVSEDRVEELQWRAEYLLDELDMGAADRFAVDTGPVDGDASPYAPSPYVTPQNSTLQWPRRQDVSSPYEGKWTPNGKADLFEPDGFEPHGDRNDGYDRVEDAGPSHVLPEDALPSIRSRPPARPVAASSAEPPWPEREQAPAHQPPARRSIPQPLYPRRVVATQPRQPVRPTESILDQPIRRQPLPVQPEPVASLSAAESRELEAEIATLYEQVQRLQETRRDITGHAFSLLREAHAIVTTRPERLARAEYNISQVRSILARARESRRRSIISGILLLVYLALLLAICAGGATALLLYAADLRAGLVDAFGAGSVFARHGFPLLWTFLLGGTGGVVGAIVALILHIRQGQDFDGQYVVRFLIQPVMGLLLGLASYLLVLFLLAALEIDLVDYAVLRWATAGLGLIAGFWQEGVYGLLYRFTQVFSFGSRRR